MIVQIIMNVRNQVNMLKPAGAPGILKNNKPKNAEKALKIKSQPLGVSIVVPTLKEAVPAGHNAPINTLITIMITTAKKNVSFNVMVCPSIQLSLL